MSLSNSQQLYIRYSNVYFEVIEHWFEDFLLLNQLVVAVGNFENVGLV